MRSRRSWLARAQTRVSPRRAPAPAPDVARLALPDGPVSARLGPASTDTAPCRVGYDVAKRTLDLSVSLPVALASLPIQALIALAVRRRLGTPVLFRQTRPGLGGRPFTMVKFRTMHPVDPARGWTDDASRMDAFGAWLRSTSLDELPTLWSVVRGDLSLVGPRPLLMSYLERYTPTQARRHEVKPGLTGLAQINGRNAITWDDRLRLDVQYVDTRSLRLDLAILLRTLGLVLSRHGVAAPGESTMSEFRGSAPDALAQEGA